MDKSQSLDQSLKLNKTNEPQSVSGHCQKINDKKHFKKLHLIPKFVYLPHNSKKFQVRLFQHCKLQMTSNAILSDKKLISALPRMNYLRTFQAFQDPSSTPSIYFLLRKLPRVKSIKLYSTQKCNYHSAQKYISSLRNLRPNIESFELEFSPAGTQNLLINHIIINSVVKRLRCMNSLKSLRLIVNNDNTQTIDNTRKIEAEPLYQDQEVKLCQKRLQRHRSLADMQIVSLNMTAPILKCFTHNLSHFERLKSIQVISYDNDHGKILIEHLNRIKTLESIVLYNHVEPNDLLTLMANLPHLRKIAIKNDWMFTSKSMPVLETLKHTKISLTHFHFDFPIEIEDEGDINLIASILNILEKIVSLKLYLCCASGSKLYPVIESVKRLTHLEELIFGISVSTENIAIRAFSMLNNLANLKTLTLVIKPLNKWGEEFENLYKSMEDLIMQSKGLRKFRIFWEKLSPLSLKRLVKLISKVVNLDVLEIGYTSSYLKHSKHHENMLLDIEKAVERRTDVKEMKLIVSCPRNNYYSCKGNAILMKEKIIKSKIFKSFRLNLEQEVETSFCGVKLLEAKPLVIAKKRDNSYR